MEYEEMNISDKLLWIEQNMPNDCEFLLRTNHDPDGCSGYKLQEGKWLVHLLRSKGHRDLGNVEHTTVFLQVGNNLDEMLNNIIISICTNK